MPRDSELAFGISKLRLGIALVVLLALVVFTVHHLSEARRFAELVERSQPSWVLLALALQLATYVCAGGIWQLVAASAGRRLRIVDLARLAVEKLSIDQFIPAGGMAGNIVVVSTLRRLGLPTALATEAMLIDLLSFYIAHALAAVAVLWMLWLDGNMTPVVVGLALGFCVVLAVVPLGIVWLVRYRHQRPGGFLARIQALSRLRAAIAEVSTDRIGSPRLLVLGAVLHAAIFLLDAATLWSMLQALGTPVPLSSCFVALIMASIAGMLSFLPGGLGGYDVGLVAMLVLLGEPLEVALTGTLLTRGVDLWLPLIPGLFFARRELWPGGRQRAPG